MTIYRCDRCGKEQKDQSDFNRFCKQSMVGGHPTQEPLAELCKHCMEAVIEFCQPIPQCATPHHTS